mmetsp:Transcript_100544/g.319414  ORF Transcript_100544/g.319414 Transcript_100544/m.319414 type:complete len:207 (-) Transcript_100544:89-709(-)
MSLGLPQGKLLRRLPSLLHTVHSSLHWQDGGRRCSWPLPLASCCSCCGRRLRSLGAELSALGLLAWLRLPANLWLLQSRGLRTQRGRVNDAPLLTVDRARARVADKRVVHQPAQAPAFCEAQVLDFEHRVPAGQGLGRRVTGTDQRRALVGSASLQGCVGEDAHAQHQEEHGVRPAPVLYGASILLLPELFVGMDRATEAHAAWVP